MTEWQDLTDEELAETPKKSLSDDSRVLSGPADGSSPSTYVCTYCGAAWPDAGCTHNAGCTKPGS